MANYKRLFGQTATYGISSIIGRLLNYFLVPLYVRIIPPEEYGIVTELYAHIALAMVVFTYGMETAYFRFAVKVQDEHKLFSTSFLSLLFSSLILGGLIIAFSSPIAGWLEYPGKERFIIYLAVILATDAISAVPFARLRQQNRPGRFVAGRMLNIFINIGLNLYFLVACPFLLAHGLDYLVWFYNPDWKVEYIFISNVVASIVVLLFLSREWLSVRWVFNTPLWKEVMIYALPLLPAGLAGMVNESFSRIMLADLLPYSVEENRRLLGIFGANYKLSMLMTLAIQAYRMAAEPFFFSLMKQQDARLHYARIMNVFVAVCGIIFLGIMMHISIIKDLFLGNRFPDYQEGTGVVPVLLYANLFLGIFINLSIWYKLADKTGYGARFTIFGALITIGLNFLLIPVWGYMGSAWATFICYFSMMVYCYLSGRKRYPIPYQVGKITGYLLLAAFLYGVSISIRHYATGLHPVWGQVIDSSLFIIYIAVAYKEFKIGSSKVKGE